MFKSRPFIYALFAVTAFADASAATAADIAAVNGKSITEQDYELFVQENKQHQSASIDRQQVIDELINRELIFQDAMSNGLDKNPELLKKLEMIKLNLLIGSALEKAVDTPGNYRQRFKKTVQRKARQLCSERIQSTAYSCK